ncbi:hypothetical protein EML15_01990 [Corynebacterium sp. sy017]|uniref:Rv0361 family membrane protein n=1 Tax=unclassified Corynebacterium TaxID=2624378 RepID=UPI001184D5B6|nr:MULTISPECIES: hypothetical protein [unclassified Corynebacterium]MBP3087928.1 hypothetical protein [Corynebacterium sp. sy017]TSD92466.1 hypothetical protein ELY17_01990 [Corynebacterium sp. SY003]
MSHHNNIRFSKRNARKTAIVMLCAASTFTLVACGNDKDSAASAGSSATSSSAKTTASSAATTTEHSETSAALESSPAPESTSVAEPSHNVAPEQPQGQAPTPADAAAPVAPAAPPAPVEPPVPLGNDVTAPGVAEVNGGPATPEDAAAIEALERNISQATTLREYVSYVPNNTCRQVQAERGGEAAMNTDSVPDTPLAQVPAYQQANPTIDKVSNIKVEGDTASAQVTASTGGTPTTATHRYLKEDGRWKFCK